MFMCPSVGNIRLMQEIRDVPGNRTLQLSLIPVM